MPEASLGIYEPIDLDLGTLADLFSVASHQPRGGASTGQQYTHHVLTFPDHSVALAIQAPGAAQAVLIAIHGVLSAAELIARFASDDSS